MTVAPLPVCVSVPLGPVAIPVSCQGVNLQMNKIWGSSPSSIAFGRRGPLVLLYSSVSLVSVVK